MEWIGEFLQIMMGLLNIELPIIDVKLVTLLVFITVISLFIRLLKRLFGFDNSGNNGS